MLEKGKSTTGLARTIVDWAKGVGARHNAALLRGDPISYYEGAQYRLADALVFQVRIILEFYLKIGISGIIWHRLG